MWAVGRCPPAARLRLLQAIHAFRNISNITVATPRAVIHIDLDAFFASVEVKKRPELAGAPVIVGGTGDPSSRGVVSAASYEARARGVRSGMALRKAKKLCPEAEFLPVDFEAYERESESFMEILRGYSPLVESFGLDEAFVEITAVEGPENFESAVAIAREMKRKIKRTLGLSASAGVAPNKLLAKIASSMEKPGGLFVIREGTETAVLHDLPVRALPGVGPKTESRLKTLGASTIGELADMQRAFLERNFGPNIGRTLYEHARGVDDSPVVPFHEPGSMSREVTFEHDTGDLYVIKETLYALTEDVAARLRRERYKAGTVTIKVRYSDFHTITRSRTVEEPTDSMNTIWGAALGLIEEVEFPKKIRLVGVKASGLVGG